MIDFKKNNYKAFLKYIVLFFFFLLCLLFFYTVYRGDTYANYGFSYAISRGEIPYLDFNMVITPLSPLLYSFGLFIWRDLLTIYIEQSILLCVLFYFLDKLVGKRTYLFLLGLSLFYPISLCTFIFPGYNFLVFLLLIILFYLLKYKNNSLIIGIVLGLIFCTKQTLGLVLFFPSLYYFFKDRRIFIKRLIGFLIPILIMMFSLLLLGGFKEFINLCFLGLFNFGSSNVGIDVFYLILLILGIFYLLFKIYKNKRDYELYYLLLFGFISFPIVDYFHVSLFLIGILYLICRDVKISDRFYKFIILFTAFFVVVSFIIENLYFNNKLRVYNYNHFSLSFIDIDYNNNVNNVTKYLSLYDSDSVYYLIRGSEAYFFKIINNKDITYYDLLNHGNYGYNGEDKIISNIYNLNSGSILVVDKSLCIKGGSTQFICDTYKVLDKCKLLEEYGQFQIYIKEK